MPNPTNNRNLKVTRQEVLRTPLSSYKLNNKFKSAIIPRAHLQVLNGIAKSINPNGFFDWGKSIWEGAKSFVPGLKHVEDLVGHVKSGAKWVKDFWEKPSLDKAIEGGKALYKHGKENLEKLSKLKEGDYSQLGHDSFQATPSQRAKVAKAKKSRANFLATYNLITDKGPTLVNRVGADVLKPISLSDISSSRTIVDAKNPRIKGDNRHNEQMKQTFASSNLILEITSGTYTTGQVIATFPITPSFWDSRTQKLSGLYELIEYKKIVAKLNTYANNTIGGGFALFFDPDPDSSWLIGSTGINNLQRARNMLGFKSQEVFKTFESHCPLESLKDLYFINPANSDSRLLYPGTLIVMAIAGTTITSGNELQLELNCEGCFLCENDSYSPDSYSSSLMCTGNATSTTWPSLLSNQDLLSTAFFGNAQSNPFYLVNTSRSVPLSSSNVPSATSFLSLPPGTYDIDVDLDVGSATSGVSTTAPTMQNSTNVTVVYSSLVTLSGTTASARTGSYQVPGNGASTNTFSTTNYGLIGRIRIVVSPVAGTGTNLVGYVQTVPPLTQFPAQSTVSPVNTNTTPAGTVSLSYSPQFNFTRLAVRITQIWDSVSPYGIALESIQQIGQDMLNKSLKDVHSIAETLDEHNPKHCPICKHHHHVIDIKIEEDDCEEDLKSDSENSYQQVTEQEFDDRRERINKQIASYQKAMESLKAQIHIGGEGPTNKQMHSLNGNIKPKIINSEEYKKFLANGSYEIKKHPPKPKPAEEELKILRAKLNKIRIAHMNLLHQTNQTLSNLNLTKLKPRNNSKVNKNKL